MKIMSNAWSCRHIVMLTTMMMKVKRLFTSHFSNLKSIWVLELENVNTFFLEIILFFRISRFLISLLSAALFAWVITMREWKYRTYRILMMKKYLRELDKTVITWSIILWALNHHHVKQTSILVNKFQYFRRESHSHSNNKTFQWLLSAFGHWYFFYEMNSLSW